MMDGIKLSSAQEGVVDHPLQGSIFLEGPAGSGKTTAALARLGKILAEVRGDQVLILVPQRSLGSPYQEFINTNRSLRGGIPSILTLGGLARRLVELFWPVVAEDAGFPSAVGQPQFLSTETAQYCMERVIAPFLDQGYFRSVTIEKNRLYGQLLDNLNKSAVVGIPLSELSHRLKHTNTLTPEFSIAFDQVQTCAEEFRNYCLENRLLDYSLLIEVLVRHIWPRSICREYFFKTWRGLIVENVEEDVPAAHDLVKQWIPEMDSSLVIYDRNGGYRQFLGADPVSAYSIKDTCAQKLVLDQPVSTNENLQRFRMEFSHCIQHKKSQTTDLDFSAVVEVRDYHFYPEMIQEICREIKALTETGSTSPDNIVIVSPYLSDALNFSLDMTMTRMGIPVRSSRPSRKYLTEPVVRAILTLARLAHPQWNLPVTSLDLRAALMVVIPGLDVVRADLVARTLFSDRRPQEGLRSFDTLTNRVMQERITFMVGEKLEAIRGWLERYRSGSPLPLDVFLSTLYGELLSQSGFTLYTDFPAAESIAKMIQSVRSFRQFAWEFLGIDEVSSGLEYLRVVEGGLLPSAIFSNQNEWLPAVQVSPAHTFLMENRMVQMQYWLDVGSMGWWERLNQPLTNPYLLNRNVDHSQQWTEAHEFNANQDTMQRVVEGLVNRCTGRIIANAVRINEYGSETRGPLQQAFQTLQKRIYLSSEGDHV